MSQHEIVVSNIGVVLNTSDETEAGQMFDLYRERVESITGRAAGESVTWLQGGNIHKEHLSVGGRLEQFRTEVTERLEELEKKFDDLDLDDEMERYLNRHNYVDESQVERMTEEYIQNTDLVDKETLDDYVNKDEFASEIEDAIKELDIVKDVVRAGIEASSDIQLKNRDVMKRLAEVETAFAALRGGSVWTRLRWLVIGQL